MNVEIVGAGVENKGAEMMLRAVLERFSGRGDIAFCVPSSARKLDFASRAAFGLATAVDAFESGLKGWLKRNAFWRFAPPRLESVAGLVREERIDVALDISGYRYGDGFSAISIRNQVEHYRRIKKNGAKVVLLPQAFGPFKGDKAVFLQLFAIVDRAYVRDGRSMSMLMEAFPEMAPKFRPGPDFTGELRSGRDGTVVHRDEAVLLPNKRMLDRTAVGEGYIDALAEAARHCRDTLGLEVVFMAFGGKEDVEVATKIVERAGLPPSVIDDGDLGSARSRIAASRLVIGSRFHGLVSGLDLGVPCVAIGWSHKYEELFGQYGIGDFVSRDPADSRALAGLIDRLAKGLEREVVIRKISEENRRRGEAIASFWSDMEELLD